VFCAGAGSDRLAVAAGASPDPRIVPFRGSYPYLRPERRELVRSLIYPVPDPSLPFLGVHLRRHIDGEVSLGPTALLAPHALRDLTWPGTWRVARRWWRTGAANTMYAPIDPQPGLFSFTSSIDETTVTAEGDFGYAASAVLEADVTVPGDTYRRAQQLQPGEPIACVPRS
jgi:2-hydroxyglutarate dehydrogenase